MTPASRRSAAWLLALALAACAGKQHPAEELLGRVQVAVLAGAEDESRYAPEEFRALQAKLAGLQEAFEAKRYAVVLADGPGLLAAAQALAAQAAARKTTATAALSARWAQLAATLPDRLMNLDERVEAAARGPRKSVQRTDVPAARRALREAGSLWSKARSAFASGNLKEAVQAAEDVAAQLDVLAAQATV